MDAALENAPCSSGGVTTDEGNSGSGGRVSCARDLVSGHVGSVMFGAQRGSLGTRGRPAEPQLALVTGGHGDHALPLEWPTDVDDFTFCTTTFSTTDGEMVLRSVQRLDVMDNPAVVDVVSGVKLWEGSVDLARHLAGMLPGQAGLGGRVLELGAGHGLPGLMAIMRHGAQVDFHDLSTDVLKQVTAVNIVANGVASSPRLIHGLWQELFRSEGVATYDVVIAAEAIYNVDAYKDLSDLLGRCLGDGGVAWFAGKRFYFGCGGGTISFAAHLRELGFSVHVARTFEDGRSNIREILQISADDAAHRPDFVVKRRRLAPTASCADTSQSQPPPSPHVRENVQTPTETPL